MSIKTVLKKLSPIHIVALVCAVLIFAAVVTSAVLFGIGLANDAKKEFDFTKNPEKYIKEFNYNTAFDIAPEYNKLRDDDINNTILGLVAGEKNKNSGVTSEYNASTIINVGDEVKIYYRGQTLLEEEGGKDYFDGGCNFVGKAYASLSAYNLAIGGDSFIAGFSLNLDGKTVGDFPKFEAIRGEEVTTSHIAFISYTRQLVDYNDYSGVETLGNSESATAVYVDLSVADLAKINDSYGAGFTDYIIGKVADGKNIIDTKSLDKNNNDKVDTEEEVRLTNADGDLYKYTKIAVEYVMAADYYTNYAPIKVEFPANYSSADLAGKEAYFEVLIESVKEYSYDNVAENAVSLKTLRDSNASADDVAAAKAIINPILKAALEEKDEDFMKTIAENDKDTADYFALYSVYLREKDEKNNKLAYENIRSRAIIDALVEKVEFTEDEKYLKDLTPYIDAKYNATVVTFLEAYSQNSSSYTIEEYAELYFDLTDEEYYFTEGEDKIYNWHKAARTTAENYYKERLVIQYIIDKANLNDGTVVVNDVEMTPYEAAYAKLCDDFSESAKISYANQNDIDLENMTENEEKQIRDVVHNFLSGAVDGFLSLYDYITEYANYQLVIDYYTTGAGAEYITEN